jgi:O-acetylhomoserine (thiol)-lyase
MRDFGSIQSPQNAFYINLGLESLHVRMARHAENGKRVAEYLASDDRISWVKYPDLKGDKYYDLAKKYMPNGTCGVVSFGVKGGRKAAEKFMKNLKVAAIETHVADARTCCLHPANATHRQLSDADLELAGISPDLIRYSCGIENADDLIDDIKQALDTLSE